MKTILMEFERIYKQNSKKVLIDLLGLYCVGILNVSLFLNFEFKYGALSCVAYFVWGIILEIKWEISRKLKGTYFRKYFEIPLIAISILALGIRMLIFL